MRYAKRPLSGQLAIDFWLLKWYTSFKYILKAGPDMLIEKYADARGCLQGNTILLTGAGGGIGLEAAKAFAYMQATVIVAEIDKTKGTQAVREIKAAFPDARVEFIAVDLSEERQITDMCDNFIKDYGYPDIIFHNAAVTPMGNVEEVPIEIWDKSYRVNFRAPLLMTQLFLPEMKRRRRGTIVFVPSSGAAPYMGAYEVFKTAQVELCNTLAGELEGSRVYTYAIGPGLVKTETAMRGIQTVAARMGMSTDEFYAMNAEHMLSAEEAGCGFAVSVLSAEKYNGQEIGSIQALLAYDLLPQAQEPSAHPETDYQKIIPLVRQMIDVYSEQYAGWMKRNVFERQWVLRDFKKTVGISAEQFQNDLQHLKKNLDAGKTASYESYRNHFKNLNRYFEHQYKLLQGYEKNPDTLEKNSEILLSWVKELTAIENV